MTRAPYIPWLLLIVALLLWGVVGYGYFTIESLLASRESSATELQSASQDQRLAIRNHSLAQEVVGDRLRLEAYLTKDPIAISTIIQSAGTPLGVSVVVSAATLEVVKPKAGFALPAGVQMYGFVVSASGSFAQMTDLVARFESLPLISSIETFDLQQVPDTEKKTASWHLNARIRVYSSGISS